MDGHGINGHNVSNYVKQILPETLESEIAQKPANGDEWLI